jgi:hypothetical protein
MKKFKTIILITGLLVALSAFSVVAQNRPQKTSSAKAYYGYSQAKQQKYKVKKKKTVRPKRSKLARKNEGILRRRYSRS